MPEKAGWDEDGSHKSSHAVASATRLAWDDLVGDKMKFVCDNQEVSVTFHEDIAISLELPAHVVLQVTEAEISAKGDTVTNDKKGAVCETGLAVRVPPYIDSGEWIKVHTDTGDFLSRADGPDA